MLFVISKKRLKRNYKYSSYNIIKKPYLIDLRQKFWFDKINNKRCLVFIHTINPYFSLTNIFYNNNFIFPESIFFIKKIFNNKITFYDILNEIIKDQKLNNHYTIDDPRNIKTYANVLNSYSIDLFVFMHGRFNKTHDQLFDIKFKKYYVWSHYFKNLYLTYSRNNVANNIEIIGHPNFNQNYLSRSLDNSKKILIIEEDLISDDEYLKLFQILTHLKNEILFKLKPGSNKNREKIKKIIKTTEIKNIYDCILQNDVMVIVGFYSTSLFESFLIEIPSIVLKNNTKYFDDFLISSHPYICKYEDIFSFIKQINFYDTKNRLKIQKYRDAIWDRDLFVDEFLIEFVNNHNNLNNESNNFNK